MQMQVSLGEARKIVPVKVFSPERRATVWEQILFVVWFFSLSLPLPSFGPVRYVCMITMLAIFAWHNRVTVPMLIRSWPILLMPVMGVLSVLWTPYPQKAFPTSILILLLPFFLVTIASRLRAVEFFRVMMLGGTFAVLYCIPYIPTLSEGGPYAQKNVLAYQMMLVALISLLVALNKDEHFLLRLVATVSTGLAFTFQLLADSATSLILVLLGSFFLITVKALWSPAGKVANLRMILFSIVMIVILIVTLIISMLPNNSLLADFLGLVGKDSTLTGRTDIWIAAEMAAAEHPWIGVGFEGFWHPDTGLAQTLNELTNTAPGTPISFHSTFWEIRVHLGFIGLGLLIFAMTWSGVRTVGLWLKDGSLVNSALMLFFFLILVSCFTESYGVGSFSPMTALLYFGGLAAFRSGERKYLGTARLVENDA